MDAYQSVGIRRRLKRFFRRDGRALIFAMDHGFEHGPTDFEPVWEHVNPRIIIRKVVRAGVDGVMMLPGIVRMAGDELKPDTGGLMIKLTSKTELRPKEEQLLQSQLGYVEDAIKLGADAIAATVYWGGSPQEDVMMRQFAEIASYAHDLGFPVVQFAYPRGPTSTRSTARRRTTASLCTVQGPRLRPGGPT